MSIYRSIYLSIYLCICPACKDRVVDDIKPWPKLEGSFAPCPRLNFGADARRNVNVPWPQVPVLRFPR